MGWELKLSADGNPFGENREYGIMMTMIKLNLRHTGARGNAAEK